MTFTREQKTLIADELKRFVADELGNEIGSFEAEDLAEFVIERIGPWIYNQGVTDARKTLAKHVDGIQDEMSLLEKRSPLDR